MTEPSDDLKQRVALLEQRAREADEAQAAQDEHDRKMELRAWVKSQQPRHWLDLDADAGQQPLLRRAA